MKRYSKQVRDMAEIAIISALFCISALIYIPFAVPITLQTLILFLSLFTVGGKKTTISTAVYVMLGAIGLPVFSGFSGGIGRLFDTTGGYIFGMLLGAVVFWIMEKMPDTKLNTVIKSASVILTVYLVGTVWYSAVYVGGGFGYILTVCVLPFIIPDAIKIYLAYIISKRIRLSD